MNEFLHRINGHGWWAWMLLSFVLSTALVYIGRLRVGSTNVNTACVLGVATTLLLLTVAR